MSKTEKKVIKASMYDVIRNPVITEKSGNAAGFNKVTFVVSPCADKQSIKSAVEALFNVTVKKVNIINRMGKLKRFKGTLGKRNDQKRAIVTIAEGQQIDIASVL